MTIPAERDARRDHALRGIPIAVYNRLVDEADPILDPVEWVEVRRMWLCAELAIGKTAAAEAMELLVSLGYLQLDTSVATAPGQARRYRLYYRRHVPVDSTQPQEPAA